jgi:hypothetical protein
MQVNNNSFFLSCILFVTLLNGCTTTQTDEAITLHQPITSGEGIVLLSDFVNSSVEYSDKDVDKCLGKWMREFNPKLKFVAAHEFRNQLYPYFSASTAPRTVEEYQILLNNRLVKDRIRAMEVRYLIVHGGKTSQDYHGSILPVFGGGSVGGFLGLLWWNRHTAFDAQIWDMKTGESKGKINVQSSGTGILPSMGLPIPLYLPATEKASCKELAKHIVSALPLE